MGKITRLFSLAFFLIISRGLAQNALNVQITGSCATVSGIYNPTGIVNGKNQYVAVFNNGGILTNVYLQFDGTNWILNSGEVINDNILFANTNVLPNASPPLSNWILAGCPNGTMTVNQILAINNFLETEILNFRNPIENSFSLDINENDLQNLKLEIYNLFGAKVREGNIIDQENINISELQTGTYIVKVTNKENKIFKGKLLKK